MNSISRPCLVVVNLFAMTVLQACGCDAVTWVNGLSLRLDSLPTAQFQVQLFVSGVLQPSASSAVCRMNSGCVQEIVFNTKATENVMVRVTTSAGVYHTALPRIHYGTSTLNNGCGTTCDFARVTVKVPQ